MEQNPADLINIEASTSYGLAEHEIKLCFNEDAHTELFLDWWHAVGQKQFGAWCAATIPSRTNKLREQLAEAEDRGAIHTIRLIKSLLKELGEQE